MGGGGGTRQLSTWLNRHFLIIFVLAITYVYYFYQAGPVGAEVPSQQYTGDAIPTLMGDPVSVGSFPPAADPGVFGQPVQAMTQPQEVFVPPAQQQGMLVPSQPQPGPRAVVPQMVRHSFNTFSLRNEEEEPHCRFFPIAQYNG